MGLRLVHAVVVGQYEGAFAIRSHDGGTAAEIVLDQERLRQEGQS